MQEHFTVVQQELMVRVWGLPTQQGQQVPPINHPGGGGVGDTLAVNQTGVPQCQYGGPAASLLFHPCIVP